MRIPSTLVIAAAVAVAIGTGAGVAAAAAGGEHVSARGTTAIGMVDFDIARTADGALSGYFTADVMVAGSPTLLHVEGPPTCLTVSGAEAAFVYPVASMTTPVQSGPPPVPLAIEVTMADGGDAGHDRLGFVGPIPLADAGPCPLLPSPLAFTGDMDVAPAG